MIVKIDQDLLVQKCSTCGKLHSHYYSDLTIDRSFIRLPACSCGSLEILHNNNADDSHSVLVTKAFAKVATQG